MVRLRSRHNNHASSDRSDSIEIGFNSRYLLEMMAQVEGDSAQFVLADSSSPAIVRDSADIGALYVVMPMRV